MQLQKRRVVVRELKPTGWEAQDLLYGWTRTYKTLNHCLRALDRHDRQAADRGINTVRVVETNCITWVGKLVAQTLMEG